MNQLAPIQINGDTIAIPLGYFGDTTDLELWTDGMFAHIRPKNSTQSTPRVPGTAIGQIEVLPDFYEPWSDEFLDLFE